MIILRLNVFFLQQQRQAKRIEVLHRHRHIHKMNWYRFYSLSNQCLGSETDWHYSETRKNQTETIIKWLRMIFWLSIKFQEQSSNIRIFLCSCHNKKSVISRYRKLIFFHRESVPDKVMLNIIKISRKCTYHFMTIFCLWIK